MREMIIMNRERIVGMLCVAVGVTVFVLTSIYLSQYVEVVVFQYTWDLTGGVLIVGGYDSRPYLLFNKLLYVSSLALIGIGIIFDFMGLSIEKDNAEE